MEIKLKKHNMSKTFISLNLILSVMLTTWMPVRIFAQVNGMAATMPVDGYVILSNGDTLNGKIKWSLKYVENNPVEIKFTAENGSAKVFSASEIPGFGNYIRMTKRDFDTPLETELENYESMPSFKKGVPVFLNRLLDGRIKVFQNRSSIGQGGDKMETISIFDGLKFSFSRGEGLMIGPTYRTSYRVIEGRTRYSSYFVTKDHGALLKIEKDNFDSIFSTLLEDCPEIQQELGKNPDLRSFKNFMLLAEVYNQLCTGQKDSVK
jgi:hypothetical protein